MLRPGPLGRADPDTRILPDTHRCGLRRSGGHFRPDSALVHQPSTCKGHGRGFAEKSSVILAVLAHMRKSAGACRVTDQSTRPCTQQSHSTARQSLTPDKGQRRRVVDLPECILQCSLRDATVSRQLGQCHRRRESLVYQAAGGDDNGSAQFLQDRERGIAVFVEQHAAARHRSTRLDHEYQQVSPAGHEESTCARAPARTSLFGVSGCPRKRALAG